MTDTTPTTADQEKFVDLLVMDQEQAVKEMAKKVAAIDALIEESRKFADTFGLDFTVDIYQLSATYHGVGSEDRESYEDNDGWYSSFIDN